MSSEPASFPIVGIGASAGGLAAFEAFFSGLPADTDPNMAFVLVQHLAPDHKSMLADIIRRVTHLQVFQVEDGMTVNPNCVYIIPPNRNMALRDGVLHLTEYELPHGQWMPVDHFFRSLAQDQRERAIAVVLSGSGSDGSTGVRDVKGEGGLVLVHDPKTAEFDGMPRCAIATGMVDHELPPAKMPARIMAYVHQAAYTSADSATSGSRYDQQYIFEQLRTHSGHDFSGYKPKSFQRCIQRRMAIRQIHGLQAYARYLRDAPEEVDALFHDLLIGVTSFFRDPDMFDALAEKVLPKIFDDKSPRDPIRIWSAGCSTGEEAYSLAILLAEMQAKRQQKHAVQIFATDIDKRALATARTGFYPTGIAEDVAPERLEKYFLQEADGTGFRVTKAIRGMLIFSEHSVIKDPPFSRLDLISCRNLLIYFGTKLQKMLFPLFHSALNPGGFLILGNSETATKHEELFTTLDRKHKIYQGKETHHSKRQRMSNLLPSEIVGSRKSVSGSAKPVEHAKQSLHELTDKILLRHFTPAAVMVDAKGDIHYLHGRTGMYLELSPGETGVNNILRMARSGLRHELSAALHRAKMTGEMVHRSGLEVGTNGGKISINLTIHPAFPSSVDHGHNDLSSFFLIIMEQAPGTCHPAQPDPPPASSGKKDIDALLRFDAQSSTDLTKSREIIPALQEQLRATSNELTSALEDLETSKEELKSSFEEMYSVNEEMQATNEELQTSKEELQSVNEELTTVNSELQSNVAELTQVNNDMNNLLSGTGVSALFVDLDLRIVRFTPALAPLINLIQADVGRPLSQLTTNLENVDLIAQIQTVLDSLVSVETEVRSLDGSWYWMSVRPYRTMNNAINGAAITFADITRHKLLEAELLGSAQHEVPVPLFENVVATVREPLVVLDTNMNVVLANRAFSSAFQIPPDSTAGHPSFFELDNRQWDIPELRGLLEQVLHQNSVFEDYEISRDFARIGQRTLLLNARRTFTDQERSELVLLAFEDVTDRRNRETRKS